MTRQEFVSHLRAALAHLYDANRLRQNPLVHYFGLSDRFDASTALRSLLIEAISSLKPPPDAAPQQRLWRLYEALFCCYVQRLNQQAVADQLALSARQLRREQQAALDIIADRLWNQGQMDQAGHTATSPPAALDPERAEARFNQEFAWLRDAAIESPTDARAEIESAVELAQPLADHYRARLSIEGSGGALPVAAHPVAVRQILLNLLGVALARAAGAQVTVGAGAVRWLVEIRIQAGAGCPTPPAADDDTAALTISQQLAELCGGRILITDDAGGFRARVLLPALEQTPVLVVDDNADTLQLLQRYAAGTPFRVIATQSPETALDLVARHAPQIIVLDVMMPQIDGWKLLGRLRQHPSAETIPIIVCSILPQEKLALALGANALLRKPVTRQAFLSALQQQMAAVAQAGGPAPR